MMNLKIQTSVLKPYLVHVRIIILAFCLISCKQEKKDNAFTAQETITNNYEGKEVIKEVKFKHNNKNLKSIFLLKEDGELGAKGFNKELEVLIFENEAVIDEFNFKNKSLLCDLKIFIEEIKVLNEGSNQILYFPIMHRCDGEEPKLLKINIWDGKKLSYDIDVPVYFQNTESKTEFAESVAIINFKSNEIKENVYRLINKKTKIDFSKIKLKKSSKVDRKNPKCFTSLDVNKVNNFLNDPSKESFSNSFEKKKNVSLDVFINYSKNKKCLGQEISFSEVENCSDKLKCEIYCSYDVTQEDIEDGELSEEIMFVYFNKKNGIISLDKIEFEGR